METWNLKWCLLTSVMSLWLDSCGCGLPRSVSVSEKERIENVIIFVRMRFSKGLGAFPRLVSEDFYQCET